MLALSGDAEKLLGDVVMKVGEKIFLLELKATRKEVNEEWNKAPTDTRGLSQGEAEKTKRKVKHAHAWAVKLIRRYFGPTSNQSDREQIIQSMRGHHFAYWGSNVDAAPGAGQLMVEPYLAATAERHKELSVFCPAMRDAFFTATVDRPSNDSAETFQFSADWLTLESVGSRTGKLIEDCSGEGRSAYLSHDLGWSVEEAEAYVATLCKERVSEEINVVLMSSKGSFIAQAGSISDLRMLIGKGSKPTATSRLLKKNKREGTATVFRPALTFAHEPPPATGGRGPRTKP